MDDNTKSIYITHEDKTTKTRELIDNLKQKEELEEKENMDDLMDIKTSLEEVCSEVDELLELAIKKDELESQAKKIKFREMKIKRDQQNLESIRIEIEEEYQKIESEKKELKIKKINLLKECEEESKDIIQSVEKRNKELSEEVRKLSRAEYENNSLKIEIENYKEEINNLKSELNDYRQKLKSLEDVTDIEKFEYMKQQVSKVDKLYIENEKLKESYKALLEENSRIEMEYGEIESYKNSNEILRSKLERSESYIKYLKRIEQSKGNGEDGSQIIFDKIIDEQIEKDKNTLAKPYMGDEKFINGFISFCDKCGFVYDKTLVRNFICSLRSSKLTILKGYSGTGKSSLPNLFAKYLKAECIVIPVQPNWRTKQDIIGFYNYFTNKFIPTELTQTLIKANVSRDRIFLVVLDEMNLARVEYYFSEFNSKLWMDSDKRNIELFDGIGYYDGNVAKYIKDNKIQIPDNVYFIGTINEDDSVSPISDKIFDRSQVVEFMQLPSSESVGSLDLAEEQVNKKEYTKFTSFNKLEHDKTKDIDMHIVNEVNKLTKEYFNKVIGFRSLKQIQEFIKYFELSGGSRIEAIDMQLVSKFIPKLKYIYSQEQIDYLEYLKSDIQELFKKQFGCTQEQIEKLQIIIQIDEIIKEHND